MTQETIQIKERKYNKCQINKIEYDFPSHGTTCCECIQNTLKRIEQVKHKFLQCKRCGDILYNISQCNNEFTSSMQVIMCNDCYFNFLELLQPMKRNVEERMRERRFKPKPKSKPKSKPVMYRIVQVDNVTRVVIGEFESFTSASQKTGINRRIISKIATAITGCNGDYDWFKLPNDSELPKTIEPREPKEKKPRQNKYKIHQIDKETGEVIGIYANVVDAMNKTGFTYAIIDSRLRGRVNVGPHYWIKVWD